MRALVFAVMLAVCGAAQAEVTLRCPPVFQGARNSGAELTDGPPEGLAVLVPDNPGAPQPVWTLDGPAIGGQYYLVCLYPQTARATGLRRLELPVEARHVRWCRFDVPTYTLTCRTD